MCEYFDILWIFNFCVGVIVLIKIDFVECDWFDLVVDEVCEFVWDLFFEFVKIIFVSFKIGEGIECFKDEFVFMV